MDIASLVLEYLKVILNWPVTGAVVLIVFLIRHRATIDRMLPGLKKAGPIEFKEGQTEVSADILPTPSADFELLYLNSTALAGDTKMALSRLATYGPKDPVVFKNEIILSITIPDQDLEKEAIMDALLRYHLAEIKNNLLQITEKGKKFLRFLGYHI